MCLRLILALIATIGVALFINGVSAHPGRTTAEGCHVCRTNCEQWGVPYDELHCHDEHLPPAETPEPILPSEVLRLDYEGFTIWLDCERRGAIKFLYHAEPDQGTLSRHRRFYRDDEVPEYCHQTSTESYRHLEERYDRGHLVPANHVDHSEEAIRQVNFMTNVLPQAANMNRGAWLLTEEIVECYRDLDEVLVIGGVIWGETPDDDYFLASHGVATPDAFWKVLIRGQGDVIAWLIPNTAEAMHLIT